MLLSKDKLALLRLVLNNPRLLKVEPALNFFLLKYISKFKLINVDGQTVIHSHLPPLNTNAFSRFINKHLVGKVAGPSHTQIGLTNKCPFSCRYCYNKNKKGKLMETETIIKVINDLKKMGVIWFGFTGGEPLLNSDIVKIIDSIGEGCAVKLFTSGYNLNKQLASDLKEAGLFYVSVSLDHWNEDEYDRVRGKKGAYETALKAIELFKETGMHVGVSAVLTENMIKNNLEKLLDFFSYLDINEAWLSEVKPSVLDSQKEPYILNEDERLKLIKIQDIYNSKGKMTVNYLGHIEGREHFGCMAGKKMIFIDAGGEVSPCVFTPISFGNLHENPLKVILNEMREIFPTEDSCFANKNFQLFDKYYSGETPIKRLKTLELMKEVEFNPMSTFNKIYYR